MHPFFSVVIPSYNRAFHLPKAISSVLCQSFTSLELLIIDDGSTDNTKEVVNEFSVLDSRVRYIYQANSERAAARNNGIAHSRGKWISFLDSDDQYMIHHLQLLFEFVTGCNANGVVAFRYLISTALNTIEGDCCRFVGSGVGLEALLKGNPFACNFAISNCGEPILLFQESRLLSSMEDWIFLLQNFPAHGLSLLPKPSVIMSDHAGRSMNSNQAVIRARLHADTFLNLHACNLAPPQLHTITAYSYLFCATHSYLDGKRCDSLKFFLQGICYRIDLAFNLALFAKFLLGRRIARFLCLKGVS